MTSNRYNALCANSAELVEQSALSPAGEQAIDASSAGAAPINPTVGGVARAQCRMTVQNNADVDVWLNSDSEGSAAGIKLAPGELIEKSRVTAADGKWYVNIPVTGTGNVNVQFEQ